MYFKIYKKEQNEIKLSHQTVLIVITSMIYLNYKKQSLISGQGSFKPHMINKFVNIP